MAKTIIKLGREGYRTSIHTRNHVVHADEPVEDGGTGTAPTPTEILMGALGSCMAITARMYAERKGWSLEGVEIALDMQRYNGKDYPAYQGDAAFVHEVREQIVFRGPLTDEQRERLLEIVNRCPVHRVIENPAFFVDAIIDSETASTAAGGS